MGVRTLIPKKEVIEHLRIEKGMSYDRLAFLTGLSERTIFRVRAGKPTFLGSMRLIAEALGVGVEQISEPPSKLEMGMSNMETIRYAIDFILKNEDYRTFDYDKLLDFAEKLIQIVKGDILDGDMREGSVIITLRLTEDQIRRLWDFKSGSSQLKTMTFNDPKNPSIASAEAEEMIRQAEIAAWPLELELGLRKTSVIEFEDPKGLGKVRDPKSFPQ